MRETEMKKDTKRTDKHVMREIEMKKDTKRTDKHIIRGTERMDKIYSRHNQLLERKKTDKSICLQTDRQTDRYGCEAGERALIKRES